MGVHSYRTIVITMKAVAIYRTLINYISQAKNAQKLFVKLK